MTCRTPRSTLFPYTTLFRSSVAIRLRSLPRNGGNMFTVTRQRQWPDGDNVVEVSHGGLDYCNPDALGAKYAGEFEEFADPRQAVETAIEIVRAWRKDSKERIAIGVGSTNGMTLPFS